MENKSGFTPNGDLVLVLPPVIEQKTKAGIVIPDQVRDKHGKHARLGRVIAFGDDAALHPRMQGVEVGMQVLFSRYAGDEWPVDGETYLILRAENIFGPTTKAPAYEFNASISAAEAFGMNEAA